MAITSRAMLPQSQERQTVCAVIEPSAAATPAVRKILRVEATRFSRLTPVPLSAQTLRHAATKLAKALIAPAGSTTRTPQIQGGVKTWTRAARTTSQVSAPATPTVG